MNIAVIHGLTETDGESQIIGVVLNPPNDLDKRIRAWQKKNKPLDYPHQFKKFCEDENINGIQKGSGSLWCLNMEDF